MFLQTRNTPSPSADDNSPYPAASQYCVSFAWQMVALIEAVVIPLIIIGCILIFKPTWYRNLVGRFQKNRPRESNEENTRRTSNEESYQMSGARPPSNGNKDAWINKERQRWMKQFSIPMLATPPATFPDNTIHVMRALSYVSLNNASKASDSINACYEAYWVEGKDIKDSSVILKALEKALGENEAKKALEGAKDANIKEQLGKNTTEALKDGAFGLPYFVATNSKGEKETYWGFDHLGQVCGHLGLDMPREGGWRSLL